MRKGLKNSRFHCICSCIVFVSVLLYGSRGEIWRCGICGHGCTVVCYYFGNSVCRVSLYPPSSEAFEGSSVRSSFLYKK